LGFVGCAALTLWLWNRQTRRAGVVGEVEAIRVDVTASADGTLAPLAVGAWSRFDTVAAAQVVARLDDQPLRAGLKAMRQDLLRLRADLAAGEAQFQQQQADRQHDYLRDRYRLVWEIERLRLEALGRRVEIEADRVDAQRLEAQLEFLRPRQVSIDVDPMEVADVDLQRQVVAERIARNTAALEEIAQQQAAAELRLEECPALASAELEAVLAPLRRSIAVQEELIRQRELEIAALEIRAPISGTIVEIYRRPGQSVRIGEPILAIADKRSRYVISYVRQWQGIRPTRGMPVGVRTRLPGSRPVAAKVDRVGPQIELVPPHHLRDPQVLEWGQPVRIALPQDLSVRPGELVDVTFQSGRGGDAG
jgi:multidrug resistance efflux pump